MNPQAAKLVSDTFLKGAFDVFDALLSKSFHFEVEEVREADDAILRAWLADFNVCLLTRAEHGVGQVAMLLTMDEAIRIAGMVVGEAPTDKSDLTNEDRGVLKEVAESVLGGGITYLLETFGHGVEQLEDTRVMTTGPAGVQEVLGFLGGACVAASIAYGAADIEGTGVLLYSGRFESLAPANMLSSPPKNAKDVPTGPTLSAAEVSDILSGFSDEEPGAKKTASTQADVPSNIDMVLDIRLVATARLGRVELPIGEILLLGPGSIVEVGHLIDEPIELLINDKLIARGDVVVVDEKFGLRITEIVSPQERIQSLR